MDDFGGSPLGASGRGPQPLPRPGARGVHTPPTAAPPGDPPAGVDPPPDLPLGTDATGTFAVHQIQLEPGDRVVLYTDGVTDARSLSGERFDEWRLLEALETSRGKTAQEVIANLSDAAGNGVDLIERHWRSPGSS